MTYLEAIVICKKLNTEEKELDINYGAETEDYYEGSEDG